MNHQHLLVLHGWNHSSKYWSGVEDQLAKLKLHVHLPDLPGFGVQPLTSQNWSIPDYAQWVTEYVHQHILQTDPQAQVILLGHSFGGRIAAYLGSQHPSWLNQLILYAAPVLYRPTLHTRLKIISYKIGKKFSKLIPPVFHSHNLELQHADQHSLGKIFRQAVVFDQTHLLPLIQVPTDIIIGTADTEVRIQIARESQRLIPHSQLHLLPEQGHNVHLENPNLFYGLLRKIIQDRSS